MSKENNRRFLNVMFNKSGSGSISTRLSIPKEWINAMGVTPENRQVIATFDKKNKIIKIRKED